MAKYLPLPLVAMDCSIAVCEGPCPLAPGRTSSVYVVIFCMPSNVGLQSELAKNLAYSSAQMPCSPLGEMVIVSGGFLPTRPARSLCATPSELELSPNGPLEMTITKFFWQGLVIGLTYVGLVDAGNGLPGRPGAGGP